MRRLSKAALEATAYHEAGHAVAAWRQKVAIKSVSIERDDDSHGRMLFESFRVPNLETVSGRDWAERHIIVSLAGPLAQRRFRPSSARGWHGKGDYRTALDLTYELQGSAELCTAYLDWLQILTKALVDSNWQHIEAVARALLDKREVSGNDVVSIIIGSRPISEAA